MMHGDAHVESVSCTLDLKARDGGYVVMPCTFYPGKETKYTLKLSTLSGNASISPMEDSWITKRVDVRCGWGGAWQYSVRCFKLL